MPDRAGRPARPSSYSSPPPATSRAAIVPRHWEAIRSAAAAAPADGLVQLIASRLSWLLGDDRAALAQSHSAMALGGAAAITQHLEPSALRPAEYRQVAAVQTRILDETAAGDANFTRVLEQLVRLYVEPPPSAPLPRPFSIAICLRPK